MAKTRLYKSFTKVTELLLKNKPSAGILDMLVKMACSLFDGGAAAILFYDEKVQQVTVGSSYNLASDCLQFIQVKKKKEFIGHICDDKEIKFSNNIPAQFEERGDGFTATLLKNAGINAAICVPIDLEKKRLAYLNIYYREPIDGFEKDAELQNFTNLTALTMQHIRLLETTQQQSDIITTFEEVGLRVTSSFNINEIIMLFLPAAIAITKADAGGLLIIDEVNHKVLDAYEYKKEKKIAERYESTARLTEGLTGEIIKMRKPVVISDLSTYKNVNPTALEKKRASVAGFPLITREKMIGILFVDFHNPRIFTEAEMEYLTILCSQAGVALDNTLLYLKTAREAKESALLYELSQSIIATLEPGQLLSNILRRLKETFHFLRLAVLLVDSEKQELYPHTYLDYPDTFKDLRLRIGTDGIAGHVASTKHFYYSPEIRKDIHYLRVGNGEERSEVCFPLMAGDRLFGVFDCASPEVDGFTEDDIALLSSVSALIAIALENARLYQEARSLSLTDPLTMLPNRRSFEVFLDNEIKRAERYRRPFTIMMIDLDNFKDYNDQFGHVCGDEILKKFTSLMRETLREADFLGRYGGDEFIAVLSETDASKAKNTAERMKERIKKDAGDSRITMSIGIASFPDDSKEKTGLISLADRACYQAKQAGGDQIHLIS